MKEIDDTDPTKSESEVMVEVDFADLLNRVAGLMFEIDKLKLVQSESAVKMALVLTRIANLEVQRTPEMENDDPEWFG
jgi:hypothetical protein